MKRIISLLSLAFIGFHGLAQPDQVESERLRAARVAFITEKVELTPTEAETFWPVYNEFKKKEEEIRRRTMDQVRELRRSRSENDLSDKEIETMIQKRFEEEEQLLKLRRDYHQRFKEILPMKKIGRLYLAEHEFRRQLIENVRRRGPRD
ncbi:MAG: hypothetical protein LPK80_05575 [Bacteroidota bacterium]|nr:hypothetical protein [Bacteroidota bacterium]MDX5427718.1 hypothetical protein [Bacteroidota bacterium]MDX5446844.1 hypothetical protein [Bacteroidota bacterium]MDX5505613.1 hypothetical protein [Bacteroidota bacterium]